MAKKNLSLTFLDEFIYFHVAYRFVEDNTSEIIKEKLSKISLSEFEKVKVDSDLKLISILEEILPELDRNPYLSFEFENSEIFFSKKKITISYPKNLMKVGKRLNPSLKMRRFISTPIEAKIKRTDKKTINSESLTRLDSFIKIYLVPKVIEKNLPDLEDITMIFKIKYNQSTNLETLDKLIETNLFKNKKFKFENFDCEITENKNKFYFSIDPDVNSIMCSFIYDKSEFSILEHQIEEVLKKSYDKYQEIKELLKL